MIPGFKILILAALASGQAHAQDQDAEMKVEEPAGVSAPPIDPDKEARTWNPGGSSPVLSRSEKAALEERRKKVEEMAAEVREARKALENSGMKDRAERVKDLENLILTGTGKQEVGEKHLKRLEMLIEKAATAKDKQHEKALEKIEKKLEKQLEKERERQHRKEEKVKPRK
jgi:type I site-specific restriction-modification system R (restriction) subunit